MEFVWGLCFLKEAGNFLGNLANFCVSGVATQWYFYRKNRRGEIRVERPFLNLFKFHWGSVLGCAFLTATMYIFDYILDFFFVLFRNKIEQWHKRKRRLCLLRIFEWGEKILRKSGMLRFFKFVQIINYELYKLNLNSLLQCSKILWTTQYQQPFLWFQSIHKQSNFF